MSRAGGDDQRLESVACRRLVNQDTAQFESVADPGGPVAREARRREPCCPEDCQRVENGCAQFLGVCLGPCPPGYHPVFFLGSFPQQAGSGPGGSPGKAVATEQDPPGGSRIRNLHPSDPGRWVADRVAEGAESKSRSFTGEYVIVIHDVTSPPFLGRTLPTACKHLRVTGKGAGWQPQVSGEGREALG
ncbi:hypothetical protein MC885_011288 [Smutsia gigantea]|nr:hypothetical protein MC885_011288 [Smutsia gigantea]